MLAAVAALCGNLLAVGMTFKSLWPLPNGTSIRPMGLAVFLALVAGGTLACVATLVFLGLTFGRRDCVAILLALVAAVLSLGPLPASTRAMDFIVSHHALVMED